MITRMLTKPDRKSTRLNSSHTDIYPVSLHDALPISALMSLIANPRVEGGVQQVDQKIDDQEDDHQDANETRSQEHTAELQSHRYLPCFPTRRSSDLSVDVTHSESSGRGRRTAGRPED